MVKGMIVENVEEIVIVLAEGRVMMVNSVSCVFSSVAMVERRILLRRSTGLRETTHDLKWHVF